MMSPIEIDRPTALLAGLSPQQFMRRHWEKKPLLVRQAMTVAEPFVSRSELFALAAREGVESRLISGEGKRWSLQHGPFARRALPPLAQPKWTLLVQGVDLHVERAHDLLAQFRFVPDARVDDVMISYASDGGGVGPHFDSYDVFLLQIHGRRRWRIAPPGDTRLKPALPVKILSRFEPTEEWVLEPGDMLYLPPLWGHDGIAEGECMTCSFGFRSPHRDELAREMLQRALDADDPAEGPAEIYRDPSQPATATPARVPEALGRFAAAALKRWMAGQGFDTALGEVLSEPKPGVWFEPGAPLPRGAGLRLDRRTKMLYDDARVFINGEAFDAAGRDAELMHRLADARRLAAGDVARLSVGALALVGDWVEAGWLHAESTPRGGPR